jgi:hypothetical protein
MMRYHFDVLSGENIVAAERSVALPCPTAAWPWIARIAKKAHPPNRRIRVTDQSGETVFLVGIALARRYTDFNFAF